MARDQLAALITQNVAFGLRASFDASGSDFRYYPERRHLLALQYLTKRAMYGRRPRCKEESDYLRSVRVQPCIRPVFEWRTDLHCDAAAMAAGPDVIR
jgi:hypothetical protein